MEEITYIVHIEPTQEGGYVAFFPELPGCQTQGDTLPHVLEMAHDALKGYVESLWELGQPVPRPKPEHRHVGFDLPVSALVR